MKNLLILLGFSIIVFSACNNTQEPTKKHVKQYTQTCYHSDGTAYLLYWYLLTSGNRYYYYSSPTPVSNFTTINWNESTTNPISDNGFTESEGFSLENQEFSNDMQNEFHESSGFEDNSSYSESNGFESGSSDYTESGGFDDNSSSSSGSDSYDSGSGSESGGFE